MAKGVNYEGLIFWRSIFVLTLVFICQFFSPNFELRKSLASLMTTISFIRIFTGGIILSLLTLSYKALSASEVTFYSRFDLPIFILIMGGGSKRLLAGFFVTIGLIIAILNSTALNYTALLEIWIATILTAVSYLLIRLSAKKDSILVLIAPPYIGAGLIAFFLNQQLPNPPSFDLIPFYFISSISAAALYYFTAELFKRTSIGAAELTGSFSLLGVYFLEFPLIGSTPPLGTGKMALVGVSMGLALIFWEDILVWIKKMVLTQ